MPLFSYKAFLGNKKQSGYLFAANVQEAMDSLEEKGLLLSNLELCRNNESLKMPLGLVIDFSRQLAQMLKAGLALYQSLKEIESLHPIVALLRQELQAGTSLSQAMRQYDCFDSLYCSLIHAGEKTASLDESLIKAAALMERKKRLAQKITSALLYPGFLLVLSFFVLLSFFIFILPSLQDLFPENQIRGLSKSLFSLSFFLRNYYQLYLPIFIIVFFIFMQFVRKMMKTSLILKIPFLGVILQKSALCRFSSAMSSLLEGGVNILDALNLAKSVLGKPALEMVIDDAKKSLLKGSYFSKALSKAPLIPHDMIMYVEIGEKNGSLAQMFNNISKIYEQDVEQSIERFEILLQPLLLLFIASIIALVLIAIMVPLSDLQTLSF